MRRGVLSLVAIVLAIPVLYGAAIGKVSIEAAGLRLVVLAVGVAVLDRYAGPLMEQLLAAMGSQRGTGTSASHPADR